MRHPRIRTSLAEPAGACSPLQLAALTWRCTDTGREVKHAKPLCFPTTANLLLPVSVPKCVEKDPFAMLLRLQAGNLVLVWKEKSTG